MSRSPGSVLSREDSEGSGTWSVLGDQCPQANNSRGGQGLGSALMPEDKAQAILG